MVRWMDYQGWVCQPGTVTGSFRSMERQMVLPQGRQDRLGKFDQAFAIVRIGRIELARIVGVDLGAQSESACRQYVAIRVPCMWDVLRWGWTHMGE